MMLHNCSCFGVEIKQIGIGKIEIVYMANNFSYSVKYYRN